MTGSQAITRAQQQLIDEGTNPHVSPAHWYSYLTAGIQYLTKRHPECLCGSTIVTSAPGAITGANVGSELPITADFETSFIQLDRKSVV